MIEEIKDISLLKTNDVDVESAIENLGDMEMYNETLNDLFMMTPYFNTTSIKDKEKLKVIEQIQITFSFIVDVYKFN